MRIKAKIKKGKLEVKMMAKHPMMSYQEAERAKKKANFITHIIATVNGKVVFEASTSQFLSKNPYIKFQAEANGFGKGDKIEVKWVDLLGKSKKSSKKIK